MNEKGAPIPDLATTTTEGRLSGRPYVVTTRLQNTIEYIIARTDSASSDEVPAKELMIADLLKLQEKAFYWAPELTTGWDQLKMVAMRHVRHLRNGPIRTCIEACFIQAGRTCWP